MFIPTTINELDNHLSNGIHVLSIIFDASTFLITQPTEFWYHIQDNLGTYYDLMIKETLFATKVLYIIYVRAQNFLKKTQMGKFTPESLDFNSMFQDIVQKLLLHRKPPILYRK